MGGRKRDKSRGMREGGGGWGRSIGKREEADCKGRDMGVGR
jgi:hypothetical protein